MESSWSGSNGKPCGAVKKSKSIVEYGRE